MTAVVSFVLQGVAVSLVAAQTAAELTPDERTSEALLVSVVGTILQFVVAPADVRKAMAAKPPDLMQPVATKGAAAVGRVRTPGDTSARPDAPVAPKVAEKTAGPNCPTLHRQTLDRLAAIQPGPTASADAEALVARLRSQCPGWAQ